MSVEGSGPAAAAYRKVLHQLLDSRRLAHPLDDLGCRVIPHRAVRLLLPPARQLARRADGREEFLNQVRDTLDALLLEYPVRSGART